MSEWTTCVVDDIKAPTKNALVTGPFGSAIGSRFFTDSGVPLIRGSNLSQDVGTRLIDEGIVFIDPEKAIEFSRSFARRGDLIFTCWGTIDQIGLIDSRSKFETYIVSNKQMKLTPDPAKVDSLFLYYLFSNPDARAAIVNRGIGSSVPGFNLGQLRSISLRLPPLTEQRAIALVLGTLDDKIELNRRMNETLEAMARAIFQSWFVDFDPVRAKANGESTDSICQRLGLTPELLALFPDSFEDSELGEIPRGWKVQALDDVASYLNGLALQKYPTEEGADWLPVIKIAQLRAGHTLNADRANTKVPENYVIQDGDVLFSWSGSLEVDIWCGGKGALNQHLFKVTSEEYAKWFYLLWTKHHLSNFRDIAANKATTMGHIQRKHLSEAKVLCPPQEVLDEMTKVMAPVIEMTVSNRLEAARLAQVRDTLLPDLLSGKVPVSTEEDQL